MNTSNVPYTIIALPNEKRLLSEIAAGDEFAFREIFDYYRKPIYAYAMYLLKNEALADEIIQDVFLKVWVQRDQLNGVMHFRGWLYTIARNKMIDALKCQMRENSFKNSAQLTVVTNETEELVLAREYDHLVNEAIDNLSPQQQLVYNLSRKKGLKHEEIARELNISTNTVKTHLVHALRAMRKHLLPHLHIAVISMCLF
jgi:RNA polymerase sigma-70 factor (ECF subfamily)